MVYLTAMVSALTLEESHDVSARQKLAGRVTVGQAGDTSADHALSLLSGQREALPDYSSLPSVLLNMLCAPVVSFTG